MSEKTKSAVEGIVWAQMEATMACYAGGGEGLYAVLHPFVEDAYRAGVEAAGKEILSVCNHGFRKCPYHEREEGQAKKIRALAGGGEGARACVECGTTEPPLIGNGVPPSEWRCPTHRPASKEAPDE